MTKHIVIAATKPSYVPVHQVWVTPRALTSARGEIGGGLSIMASAYELPRDVRLRIAREVAPCFATWDASRPIVLLSDWVAAGREAVQP